MKRVLCYGDSNTWGYISGTDHLRYGYTERWTKILQNKLGNDYEFIEEGLCSRSLFSEDTRPGKEGRNGFTYLKPCMETHDKIDLLVLMLGTNELKLEFGNNASDVVEMMKKYVDFILNYRSEIDNSNVKLLISGVPLVTENNCFGGNDKYEAAHDKSVELNELMKQYTKEQNIMYVDNTDLETGEDGVHLTKDSHQRLAVKLSECIKTMLF